MSGRGSYVAELYRSADERVSARPTAAEIVEVIARARAQGWSLGRILRYYVLITEAELDRDAARERSLIQAA